jgi:hypothetical protein
MLGLENKNLEEGTSSYMNNLSKWFTGLALASASLLVFSAAGCGSEEGAECGDGTVEKSGVCNPTSSLKCGDGTEEKEGVCAAKAVDGLKCGDGTKEVDGNCVAEKSTKDGLKCGDGTEEKDGACIAKAVDGLKCGTGTKEDKGTCVVDPESTKKLACGQGTVEENDECVVAKMLIEGYDVSKFELVLPKTGKGIVNYPVTAMATVKSTTPFNGHMQLSMTNYEKDMKAEDVFQCFLGAFQLKHPGGDAAVEISHTFVVPATCLYGEAGKGDKDATSKMYPVLSFSQNADLQPKDLEKASIRFGDQPVTVENSPGLDIKLTNARSEFSVIVLMAVPDSVTKTPEGDLTYGAPEIKMDVEVTAYGTAVVNEKDEPLNVLDEKDLKVVYQIKPADESVKEWQPIFLHEEGDPAKADGDEKPIDSLDGAEETEVIAQSPHYLDHGLYVEDDCGTKCASPVCKMSTFGATCAADGYCKLDAAKGECDAKKIARSMIMTGAWKDFDKFVIRTCLEGGGQHPLAKDNDCVDDEVMIVRIDNSEVVNVDGTEGDGNLASVQWAKKTWVKNYYRNVGGSALMLKTYMNSETAMRYWTPAFGTDNKAGVTITSKYVGSRDILKGWAKGHVGATNGWAYDYGLTTFGSKIWGGAASKPKAFKYTYAWKSSKSWSKSKGWSFTFWAGPVPLSVSFGFKGSANIAYGFTISAQFSQTTKDDGKAWADLKPYVKPGASLSAYAEAGVNLLIAKGGVGASLTIIGGNIPLTMYGKITVANPVTKRTAVLKADVDLDFSLTTLSGKVYAYAKLWSISCKNWRPWSCSSGYKTVWTGNIFSFSGYTWKYALYDYHKTWTFKW